MRQKPPLEWLQEPAVAAGRLDRSDRPSCDLRDVCILSSAGL